MSVARACFSVLSLLVLVPACRCNERLVQSAHDCEGDERRACSTGQMGACGAGEQACVGGSWVACVGTTAPSAETCNGVDDDCDGEVDEGLGAKTCGVGACQRSISACSIETACVPGTPSPEVCDGLDNDCDGQVDEELPELSCGSGLCANTAPSCVGGVPGTCAPKMPGVEVCDGIDNDCDGTVDEDLLSNVSADLRVTQNDAASDYVYSTWAGNQLGVAWVDKRDGNEEIYFALLDSHGQRVSADRRVTNTSGSSTHPALAWTGTHFTLVWAEGTGTARELWFVRLNTDGTSATTAKAITNATGSSDWPDVVWTGTELAVAWQDDRNGNSDIYFARYDADGTRQGNEVRVTTDTSTQRGPVLKKGGNGFAVVWTDHRQGSANLEIYAHLLGATGQLNGGNDVRISNATGESSWPDLAWNGNGWAVVWQDMRFGEAEIFMARFTDTMSPVGETRITNATGVSGYPSVDWNGAQYGLSWNDDRSGSASIYFATVTAQGTKNGSDLRVSNGSSTSVFTTAVWTGSFYAFLWKDTRDGPSGNSEVYFAQVGCPK